MYWNDNYILAEDPVSGQRFLECRYFSANYAQVTSGKLSKSQADLYHRIIPEGDKSVEGMYYTATSSLRI